MLPLRFIATPLLLVAGFASASPSDAATTNGVPRRYDAVTLESAEPFRLIVGSGTQSITVRGTNFENAGHPIRDQYMHWQVRRDDGGWERCATRILNTTATCRTTGWANNSETIEIGGTYTARAGHVELRAFQGLADEAETNPRNSNTPTDWSNVLRVPVVVPGPAPVISSITPATLPLSGDASAYRMTVSATNLDPSAVVVFRGDVVAAPEAMTASAIQVTVPGKYRRTTPGELSLTVRTDRGGNSAPKYFRFEAQRAPILEGSAVARAPGVMRGMGAAAAPRSGACAAGFVWREATPQDHACVTPDARARAARQNAEAASHRANAAVVGPAPCVAGYVWREAVAGDAVCVTPAERAQTAEDTRLSASRVAP